MTITRIDRGPRMSRAVIHGDTVYLSGLVAGDTSQDITGQTKQVLAQVDEYLKHVGSDRTKVLRAEIWVSDMANFAQMNAVWDAWIDPEHPPARATVEAKLAAPEYLVEIMVTAAR